MAWKIPVPTVTPIFLNASQNSSYRFFASSGGAAEMKLGRRCPRASPYSVNCDTTRALPFTSSNERFIFPCSSSKILRLATFSAIAVATDEVSSFPTPSRIISPGPISPLIFPCTLTFARLTLCTTARILLCFSLYFVTSLLLYFALQALPFQHLRQLRHIVGKHRQHLRSFRQIVPAHMLEHIRLGVVHLVVVGHFLHAPESRHARLIERHVIRAALAAQRRLHDAHRLRQRIQHAPHGLAHIVIPHQADGQHFARAGVVHQHPRHLRQLILVRRHVRPRSIQSLFLAGEQ